MKNVAWTARHRFFLDAPLRVGDACCLDPLAHQLVAVLRLALQDTVVLVNGDGFEYCTVLTTLTPRQASGQITATRPVYTDPRIHLTLYQCTLKQDKFEWVLQKGTELGASRFAPVVSRRSVVRPAAALRTKYTRWRAILREATEQCGRTRPPMLNEASEWSELSLPPETHGFIAWEAAEEAPSLGDAAAAVMAAASAQPPRLALLVGPEGGLTQDEVNHLVARGWQVVTLGPRILRAETAALAGIAVLMERCE